MIRQFKRIEKDNWPNLRFFFLPILGCTLIDDHPQEDLAKSGYRLNMKVENCKNLFIFLLHMETN